MNWSIFILLCSHALADFPLQGKYLAIGKVRSNPRLEGMSHWLICLTYHALIHGIVVAVLLPNHYAIQYGMIIAAVHWIIDFIKHETFTPNWDQYFHIISILCMMAIIGG